MEHRKLMPVIYEVLELWELFLFEDFQCSYCYRLEKNMKSDA